MEPPPPHSYHTHSSSSSAVISNELNERQQYNCELSVSPPPPQPPPKTKKKLLKSPLAAIKNAFIRTTRPLRRQSSMIESDKKIRPNLRRQHSLMEQQRPSNNNRMIEMNPNINYDDQRHYIYSSGPQYPLRHEPFYPNDGNSTYQNLETESIYGYTNGPVYYDQQQQQQQQQQQEHLYSNRALIELERGRQYNETKYKGGGGRIVRRHSLAERSTSFYPSKYPIQQYHHDVIESVDEPIYQTRNGSYMLENVRERNEDYLSYQNRRSESIYQNRREMHRDHLYQSRSEMQERINIGKREVGLVAMDSPTLTSRNHNEDRRILKDPVYQSRRELKENGFKTRTQLRDHIYQSRREAMESMAEPIYVSKREIKHEPIYETKESDMAEVASAIEKLDLSLLRQEPSGQEQEQTEVQTNLEKYQITEVNEENDDDDDTLTNNKSDLQKSTTTAGTPGGDTVIMPPPDEIIDHNNVKAIATLSPRSLRSLPYHISNVIKRTACPPSPKINDKYASRTSVETHYQSQTSIPIGPPNAQSTPYQSEMSIGYGGSGGGNNLLPPPRQPTITRGIFTDKGGTLCDPIWNVSLIIPEGAIPKDVQQEIHFKISDPRLSEEFFGPPLDMENGEKMLSPLVMCGPQGLEFLLPVILNIPHCASRTPSLGLSVKATDSEKNLKTDWDNVELPSNIAEHTVSVKVDHF